MFSFAKVMATKIAEPINTAESSRPPKRPRTVVTTKVVKKPKSPPPDIKNLSSDPSTSKVSLVVVALSDVATKVSSSLSSDPFQDVTIVGNSLSSSETFSSSNDEADSEANTSTTRPAGFS